MNVRILLHRNLGYFSRYYRLVALAVVITVAVIVGSLVVGDSVRMTLVRRVAERLGDTETVVFSRNAFLSDTILAAPLLKGTAEGVLLTDGFISRNGKWIPVNVWGVDDPYIAEGSARMNPPLAEELGPGGDIALRLPATGLVPSGSLFVTKNYTTSLRLSNAGLLSAGEGGNRNLKNEQVLPFNLFVNRAELAGALEVEGKINLILSSRSFSAADWEETWDYGLSGLAVRRKSGCTEITSGRVFLPEEAVRTICRDNEAPNRLFSYLANTITRGEASIPYSFVTAMDRYKDQKLGKDEVLLSDYAANRLRAREGDTIRMSYYVSKGLKTLDTAEVRLRVKQVVPLSEWVADGTLSAGFPGLSDVERCTDWDSDLPIRMDRITDEDERFWELYRSTPKAIISYEAVAADWSNAFGAATAVRVANPAPVLDSLRAEMFGIRLIHPREAGIYAATNGVDFSGLFLALGFFIIVSALLLMYSPLSGMLHRRGGEIGLLRSLGYSRRRIAGLLWTETVPVVGIAVLVGIVVGILYTGLVMWLLGNVWKGATQTDGFGVYPDVRTVVAGALVSGGLSLALLWLAVVRALGEGGRRVFPRVRSLRKKAVLPVAASVAMAGGMVANFMLLRSVLLFMLMGVVWIGVAALWGDFLVFSGRRAGDAFPGKRESLSWASLYANRKQSLLSFFTLAIGVFIVFSVGLNRKGFVDSPQILTGTGGYSLWCESSVPVYYDLTTPAGKDRLALGDLPADAEILQCLRYRADDASCLNLNKVTTPTVLGVDMAALSGTDFRIEETVYQEDRSKVFAWMRESREAVYPALVDATVLTWGIGMGLGDTLYYEGDRGRRVGLRLVGTLSNSVFQGSLLVDRGLFREIWGETTGSEVFLLKTQDREEVKTLFAQALSEYGVRVTTTNERLKQFNEVTDTYLTIFMTLGGLGLLIGILSFVIVIRKNLVMRQGEIRLYFMLGFPGPLIGRILCRENIKVPLYAIFAGVTGALASVGLNFPNAGIEAWSLAAGLTFFFIGCVICFVRRIVGQEVRAAEF